MPNYSGYDPVLKFGRNTATASGEDVWDGSLAYPFPAAAAETTAVSTDAADAEAGTGARTVEIQGLDANWDRITQTVTLDGVTPVTLPTDLLRVFRASVVGVGSGGVNAGNVQIKHGATLIAQISADLGQTLMAIYSIPRNYYAWLLGWYVTVSKNATANAVLALQFRTQGEAWNTKRLVGVSQATDWIYKFDQWLRISPQTDIRVRALSVSIASDISAGFDLLLDP